MAADALNELICWWYLIFIAIFY